MPNEQTLLDLKLTAREHLDAWEGRYVDIVGPSTPESPALKPVYGRAMDALWKFVEAEADYFLETQSDEDIASKFREVAQLCANYLTGDWREQAIKDDRECLDWMDQFRFGLLAALFSEDTESLLSICGYGMGEPEFETGAFDRTRQDADAYRVACALVLGTAIDDSAKFTGARPKNFVSAVNSANGNDLLKAQRYFQSHINNYLKREHDDRGNIQFSIDSSIIVLVSRRLGVVLNVEEWDEFLIV